MLAPSSWWFPLCVFISTSEADTCVFTHRQQWTQGKCWFVCRQSSDEPHKEKVLRENQIVMKITTRPASLWKTFFNIYTGVCGDLLWNSVFISQYCSTLISLLSAFNLFVKHSFGSTPDRRNPWINIGNAQRDGVVVFFQYTKACWDSNCRYLITRPLGPGISIGEDVTYQYYLTSLSFFSPPAYTITEYLFEHPQFTPLSLC